MHVECKSCGQRIPAEDLNIDTAIAKCRVCDAVFSFADDLRRESGVTVPVRKRRPAADVPQPKGIDVQDWDGNLRITRRWFSPVFIFMIFFCVAWDGFLVFWYSIAITQDDVPWIMVVFPVAHVAVGIGLTYFTLCGFLNRTIITVDGGRLTVRHTPLPWPGNRSLDTADVKQLYCRRRIRNGRNGSSETYDLHLITSNNAKIKLASGLEDPEQALFLEQRIEQYLGIQDQPVPGEYRG